MAWITQDNSIYVIIELQTFDTYAEYGNAKKI